MRLKNGCLLVVVLATLGLVGGCASWHSDQKDANAIIDGNSPEAQATGLGDEEGMDNLADAQNSNKRTYYFDFDKSSIREADHPALEANAQYLNSHASAKALIEGHTDPRGSREYNIALGERRSKAIQAFLREQGVNASQIRIISYGSEKLAANGRAESDYQLDRRGVLVYLQQ